MPYTYTVDYDDDTPVTEMTSSADPLSLNHTFATTGTYTVEFAAWNCTLTGPVTEGRGRILRKIYLRLSFSVI